MSTTTREKFEKEFSNVGFIPESKERYIAFIEIIEKEAEKRGIQQGREEMRKEILKIIPMETPKSNGNTMNENDCIERENLLLWQIKFGISSL